MDGRKGAYEEAYRSSIGDPEGFWGEAAEAVSWYRRWDRETRREEGEKKVISTTHLLGTT